MAKERLFAGLDLGTDQVKCVIALLHDDGMVDIIGTGSAPANGFEHGSVCDNKLATESIHAAVSEASMMAGCTIVDVILSISGRHVQTFNSNGMVALKGDSVTREDIENVLRMARSVLIPAEQDVLHAIPQVFVLDGAPIKAPIGMSGVRLEVDAHVVLVKRDPLSTLIECCRRARLQVVEVVPAPLVLSEVLLSRHARDLGLLLVDIGADTTEVGLFQAGHAVLTMAIGIGGDTVTLDLRTELDTPRAEAEQIKQTKAKIGSGVAHDETIDLPGVAGRRPRSIARAKVCEIVEARVEELFTYVREELERREFVDVPPGGVVLTGGGSRLAGIEEVAERILEMPAALAEPKNVAGLVDVVKHPRFATATGLAVWGATNAGACWYSNHRPFRAPWYKALWPFR